MQISNALADNIKQKVITINVIAIAPGIIVMHQGSVVFIAELTQDKKAVLAKKGITL